MLYPQNIEQKLGFDRIRELLKEACISPLGRNFVDKMKFSDRADLVERMIKQTAEFKDILQFEPAFPSQNYLDVTRHLAKAAIEGSFLSEEESYDLKLSLKTIQECLRFFDNKEPNQYPQLRELVGNSFAGDTYQSKTNGNNLSKSKTDQNGSDQKSNHVNQNKWLKDIMLELERVIDDRGHVKDSASTELQEIRRSLISIMSGLRKKLDTVLRAAKKEGWVSDDVSLTIRNGRLVIPLAAEHKRKIKGFVQDESDSGRTVFLEPAEVLESNNEIKELESRERREIVKILINLTNRIRPFVDPLKRAYTFLGIIDFMRAKAKFANQIEANAPLFSPNPSMDWTSARHPLLYLSFLKQQKKVVPLKVTLDQENRILLVSGPNAGGKSIMLKTIGLIQYMYQCGLLVPMADFSTIGLFKNIFIDIGDEQSLDNDLSTYSSHLSNMKHFLLQSDKKTLFLIDEFGTGTEPSLGGAVAEAILDELNKSGAYGVINTHYTNLKIFADKQNGLVNGAMRFDGEALEPLYELEIGKPGSSFALEIARKIGLPKLVIDKAKQKLGNNQVSFEKLVKELDIEKKVFAAKNIEYATKQRKLDQVLAQYTALKSVLDVDKKTIMNAAKAEAKQLLKDANAKIEGTIRAIREQGAEKLATKEIRQQLQDFESVALREEKINVAKVESYLPEKKESKKESKAQKSVVDFDEEIENEIIVVGSKVRIKGQGAIGEVIALKGKDAELAIGDIKTFVKLNRLEKISRRIYKEAIGETEAPRAKLTGFDMNEKAANFSFNLDVRGKRGEEALVEVNSFVDDGLMLGYSELRIVHGKGDGILRQLIRTHLRNSYKQVKKLEDEHADRGGSGVTIIKMK